MDDLSNDDFNNPVTTKGLQRLWLYKFLAGSAALATVFALMLGPLVIIAVISDKSFSERLPDGSFLALLFGSIAGLVLAPFVHFYVLCKLGGYDKSHFKATWGTSPKP